jgi:hypothetical protein
MCLVWKIVLGSVEPQLNKSCSRGTPLISGDIVGAVRRPYIYVRAVKKRNNLCETPFDYHYNRYLVSVSKTDEKRMSAVFNGLGAYFDINLNLQWRFKGGDINFNLKWRFASDTLPGCIVTYIHTTHALSPTG